MKTKTRLLLLIGCVLTVFFSACNPQVKTVKKQQLDLHWQLVANEFKGSFMSHSTLTITNKSTDTLSNVDWVMYFNYKPCTMLKQGVTAQGVEVKHINGDLFTITPTSTMLALAPHESITIDLYGNSKAVKISDVPLGFYFEFTSATKEELIYEPKVTYGDFPQDQVMLSSNDSFPLETPQSLFDLNKEIPTMTLSPEQLLLPSPAYIKSHEGNFELNQLTSISSTDVLDEDLSFFKKLIIDQTGIELQSKDNSNFNLTIQKLSFSDSDEAYVLDITENKIYIKANTKTGLFYGIQSLLQLFPLDSSATSLPLVSVQDAPRFEYRGLMLDVARHFQTKEELFKILSVMGNYKLNKLHFHLTDDEGWRIDIPTLPELVEVGSSRSQNNNDLLPAYGSGAFGTDKSSNGYYTKSDFIEILAFAHKRNIEIIPEIEFPGHARAAIQAMEYRKTRLEKEGKTEQANKYLLNDPNDQSSYLSVQNFSNNTICPCQESTYNFLEEVVSQMQLMYNEANVPFSSLHLGADEVAQGVWENSPLCQEKVGQDSIRSRVKSYYLKRLTELGKKYQVALIFWEDIAGHQVEDKQWAKENLSIHSWSTAWGEGNEDHAYKAANAGYSTILVPVSNLYFDQSYNKNSDETGFYWGSYVNTFSAFSFLPMNMFKMDQLTKRGHQLDKNYFDSKENLTAQGSKNIRGLEGSLFAETIKNKTDLEYLLFPKLLGLAERAWAPSFVTATDTRQSAAKKTQARWLVFANLLGQRELPRLAKNNLAYRIAPVGFMINNGLLTCNTTFPGSTIMLIKTDGSIIEYKKSIAVKDIQSVYSQDVLGRKSKIVNIK